MCDKGLKTATWSRNMWEPLSFGYLISHVEALVNSHIESLMKHNCYL